MIRVWERFGVPAAGMLLVCGAAGAQTVTAGVNGTVADASGAVIPGAKVTATNVNTNVATQTVTNGDGVYVIRNLQVGQYRVVVESPGFTTQSLGPFPLETGQDAKFDAKLGVEGSTNTVGVTSELLPLLNTENPTIGTTLDTHAIESIPLVSRNFTELTLYVPGAVTGTPASFTGSSAIERNGNGTLASQNGNRQETNNYLLEGVEINETINNGIGYNVSPDAIGQVRVISANANAEFGNVGGGDVITLLKSGTNAFHGSAFFVLSNYNMDANSWANKNYASSTSFVPITPYTQSTFGGTLGGPIVKDKLFFFADYEGIRFHSAGVSTSSVATAKMRTGDFSELLDTSLSGSAIHLYNTQAAGQPEYANNQLGTVQNPVAAYLFSHPNVYPLPNHVANNNTVIGGNYQAPTKTNRYNDQFDVKINWVPSQKDTITGSYSHGKSGDFTTPVLAITFPGTNVFPFQSFSLNSVHTFSPKLINEFTAGYTRVVNLGGIPSDSTGIFGTSGNGVVGLTGVSQPYPGFVAQTFSGTNGALTTVGNSATGTTYYDNTFSYFDNATYQAGKHTIKGGVQFLRYQQNTFYPGNDGAVGHYDYTGVFTGQNGSGGYTLADFYLNRIYTRAIGGVTGLTGQRSWRDAAFVQDDWKVTPNLTLNLGMRWEFDQPIFEVNNKQANIDQPNKRVLLAGVNGASRALFNPVWTNFMPRIGFAYNPMPRFVVRGGYGITTYFEGTGANLRLNFNYPFQNSFTATGAPPSSTGPGTYFTANQGFGTASTSCNIQTSTTPCTTVIRAWDPNIRPMFLNEFNLTTEYQLSNTASITIGYLGETGQHLVTAGAANALTQPCYINGVIPSDYKTNATCAAINPAPFANLVGQNGSVVYTASNAMENYNSLQTTFRQRLHRGLQFTANYTFAKAMTNSTGFFGAQGINGQSAYAQNFYNNHAEYGPTAQDVRHNLNGNLVYALPVGRGRQFGTGMNRVLDEVVGGWSVAATGILYSGFPVNITAGTNTSYTNNNSERANHYRKLVVQNRSHLAWFGNGPSVSHQHSITVTTTNPNGTTTSVVNPQCSALGVDDGVCAYGQPGPGQFGTASVDSERAPGYQSADASVFKDFAITERQRINFRADAANVFNLTSLSNPTNNAQSATFGLISSARSQPRQLQLSAHYIF